MIQLRLYIIFWMTLAGMNVTCSQTNSTYEDAQLSNHLTNMLSSLDNYHFKGEMRYKEIGGDTFEIRNFTISYRSNPQNPLYGYDFEIAEKLSSGYIYSFMVMQDALYFIYDSSKTISRLPLPDKIDLGSLVEYMRSYFILDEVFSPFMDGPVTVIDSNNLIYLTRQMHDLADLLLVLDKETYLPIRSLSTIRNHELDLTQLLEINFQFDNNYRQFPETTLDPEHYITSGYTLKIAENRIDTSTLIKNTLSPEHRELLLHYPFISASGDTTTIASIDAKYVLLDFWYSSCLPCLKAIPELNQLAEAYSDKGLLIMGLNCFDMGIRENVTSKLRAKKISFPLLFGPRNVIESLRITSFPSYFLVTPDRGIETIDGGVDEVKKILEEIFVDSKE